MIAPTPKEAPAREPAPAFVSLGMVVLDEIHFSDGGSLVDVPGGSGFYSTLGARLAVPQSESETICCLVTAGTDFPSSVIRKIEGWDVKVRLQEVPEKLSTRGLLCYEDDVFGKKTFRYVSPPLRPDLRSLPEALLRSSVIHTLASPEDLERQAEDLKTMRSEAARHRPLIAWEPSPLHCDREWQSHRHAAIHSDVVSPNDNEVLAMKGTQGASTPYDRARVEDAAATLSGDEIFQGAEPCLPEAFDRRYVTVVRCGEHGCLTIPRRAEPVWLPPYHEIGSSKVVDPTGAGNAFLGAFAVAFKKTDDEVLASAYGAVAASFVIEQIGAPKREIVDGRELWNGEEFETRLREYRARAARWDTSVQDKSLWRSNPNWPKRTEMFG